MQPPSRVKLSTTISSLSSVTASVGLLGRGQRAPLFVQHVDGARREAEPLPVYI